MTTKRLYYVETGLGATLVASEDQDEAEETTLKEVGTYNGVKNSRLATRRDIEWVRDMGVCSGS